MAKKKTKTTKRSCNQCYREMVYRGDIFTLGGVSFPMGVCAFPDCPNYGILQVPAEEIPKG